MPLCSAAMTEAGHLESSRTVSPSVDVRETNCSFLDHDGDVRTISGCRCSTETEPISNGKGGASPPRQTLDSLWGPSSPRQTPDSLWGPSSPRQTPDSLWGPSSPRPTDRQVDKTRSVIWELHGDRTMEDSLPSVASDSQAWATGGGFGIPSCSPRGNDAVCQHSKPESVVGASAVLPWYDEAQRCPDFKLGRSPCPGLDRGVTSASTRGSDPVRCVDGCVRSGDAVSVSRASRRPKPCALSLCLPTQGGGLSVVDRSQQSAGDSLTATRAAGNHSSLLPLLQAARLPVKGCPCIAARSRDIQARAHCSTTTTTNSGCTNLRLSSPLKCTSGPGEMSAQKSLSRPQLKLVASSSPDGGSSPTSTPTMMVLSSSVSIVSSSPVPNFTVDNTSSSPLSAESHCSCRLTSLPADPSSLRRSSVSVHPPARTHSSSSMDSVDSGVWSPGPPTSPMDGLFLASSAASHPPHPMPQLPACRQLVQISPASSQPPVSPTSRQTVERPASSLSAGRLQLSASRSVVDTNPIFPLPVQASHQPSPTRQLVDSRFPSHLPQLSRQPSDSGSASSLPPVPRQHTASNPPSDCDLLCLTDYDRLERSTRALEDACFYFPELDSDGARALLQDTPLGTFLVRGSSDPRFLFAVSLKTERGPTSIRIHYEHGLFQMDCVNPTKNSFPRFETMLDLLDFHATLCRQPHGSHYRWLEASRRRDLPVRLSTPLRHSPPSLSHQARVTVNRSLEDLHLPARSTDLLPVPAAIRQFLRDYSYRI